MEKRYRWAVSELVEDAVIEKCKKPEFTGEPWGIRAGESRLGLNPAGQGRGPQPLKGSSILTYSLVTWGRWPNPLISLSHAFDRANPLGTSFVVCHQRGTASPAVTRRERCLAGRTLHYWWPPFATRRVRVNVTPANVLRLLA